MEFLLFAVGLILLIKASDFFVDSSTKLAKLFNVSEIIIGATIVSLGTTLPETLVSATSAFKGLGGIAYGNAIGSIICNTSLIAALTLVCLPGEVDKKSLYVPTSFFYVTYIVYIIFAIIFKKFDRVSGIILFSFFIVYVAIVINSERKKTEKEVNVVTKTSFSQILREFAIIIISAVFIAIGSNLLVDNGTLIAKTLHVPDSVIAVTMVALGTSLPELMTAITAIKKGHAELSIGNIIGADFFNLATVSGIAAIVSPFSIPAEKLIMGQNASYIVDIPLVGVVVSIMCIPTILKGKSDRIQGIVLLLIYVLYLTFEFVI